jgi:hypothetical protein
MRINSCIKNIPIINECEYCKKLYSNKYKLKIHMNTCKEKSIIDDITQLQLEELKNVITLENCEVVAFISKISNNNVVQATVRKVK